MKKNLAADKRRLTPIENKDAKAKAGVPTWIHCLLLFTVAFALRLDTVFQNPRRVLRGLEPQSVAETLLHTGQFANPFRTPTGPTAHLAPAHPLMLAGLMKLFPDDESYETAKR